MDTSYKFFLDLWVTISHSPTAVVIALFMMVIGACCQKSRRVPDQWISIIYVALGLVMYPLLGDRKSIPEDQRNPGMLMVALGAILAYLAFIAHYALYAFLKRFLPAGFMPGDATDKPTNENQNSSNNSNHT